LLGETKSNLDNYGGHTMTKRKIGILHPGQMGISVAASAQNSGNLVLWVSEGRSAQTGERAQKHELEDAGTLEDLCQLCSVIVSVCPPHAAEAVASQVVEAGYSGLYIDANAISPQRAVRIGQVIRGGGGILVDGGIIGGPAWEAGRTWLYLSGPYAQDAADCFSAGPLETSVIGDEIGKASALKMCYAAYTKGTSALLCAIHAAADSYNILNELQEQWSKHWPDFAEESERRVRRVTAKAWRFRGEMDEIAATFEQAGVPGDFHTGASEIYRRLADFKDAPSTPALEEVLAALTQVEEK
jgi:3-hydroxyisobutyrate dehydrogenase-like beta-hydroxyacid dehydrogenase